MSALARKLGGWIALALGVLILFTWAYFETRAHDRERARADKAQQELDNARAQLADYQSRSETVQAIAQDRAEAAVRIRTVTKELTREVPVYVPVGSCELPPGWRVLHDAAAEGSPAASSPGADGAPVAAEEAAATVIENYGACRDNADRLVKLQQYVREVVQP